MILGICTGQVYITLNVFIIVLEACLKLRADLTTSGRAIQLSRAPKTVLLSKVTLTLGINNFLVVWIENLSNFKHFHISAMSNNRITADYEFFVNWQLSLQLVRDGESRTIKTFPSSPLKMCESAQSVSCYGLVRSDWFV